MTDFHEESLRRTVIAGGIEIHYLEQGHGVPLVFVHGGMGDWSSWAPQWDAFTPRFRCFTYSRRYSSPNRNAWGGEDHSVLNEADDLSALLECWGTGSAVLVGTSYGAYTALQCALVAPHKVRALALTEPPILPFADEVPGGTEARQCFETDVLNSAGAAFARGDSEEAVRCLTVGINGSGPGEASTSIGRARRLRNAQAMRVLCASGNPYPALDRAALRTLRIPTLLTYGANTLNIHRALTDSLQMYLSHAQVTRVSQSGHGIHRDNPNEFNRVVLQFLDNAIT